RRAAARGRARASAPRSAAPRGDRGRTAFRAIPRLLDEADGKGGPLADAEERGPRQDQLAAREPGFEFNLDGRQIRLSWQNVEAVRVNYYLMDVELLFSRNPFGQQFGEQFASIRPNATRDVKLPAGQKKLEVPLPEDLA